MAQQSIENQKESAAAWVAPAVTGLKNSLTATALQSAGKHWYRDDEFKNLPARVIVFHLLAIQK